MADENAEVNGAEIEINPLLEHTLTKPIQAHGDELKVLKWREPTAGDIETAGNPVVLDFSGSGDAPKMSFDEKKLNKMISVLANVPPSSVKQLNAGDWHSIAFKISRFFMPT